ncbi:MAG: ArsR family transcriptional regulator [Pseudomonadota bacterium]|nr:ArsR family transcriptional regulator [Pseudomonadota bacterium]
MWATADISRIRLLALCTRGEFNVSELLQAFGQSQPLIFRHIKVLYAAGDHLGMAEVQEVASGSTDEYLLGVAGE